MSNSTLIRWVPLTAEDKQLVVRELHAIVSSSHFRNSKRYPRFLEHVVTKTLDGQAHILKERVLGAEVFERDLDYDTSTDPVVRFSAAEVRKRLAQFYQQNAGSAVQISLPVGSYMPEFSLVQSQALDTRIEEQPAYIDPAELAVAPTAVARWRLAPRFLATVGIAALLVAAAAFYGTYRISADRAIDRMWNPMLSSTEPVLIVAGNGPRALASGEVQDGASSIEQTHGAYNHITFSEAVALSRLTTVLATRSRTYQLKEADLATLQDIRGRPSIYIGAYNNLWTLRLLAPLRFHFAKEEGHVRIVDSNHPGGAEWALDYSKPYASATFDYAVIARYHDATTNSGTLILAGIGAYGTQAAAESISSAEGIRNLLANVPAGWEKKNIEIVLRTSIMNGQATSPQLVAYTTW